MHLAIDARCLHDHQGGIGFATMNLLSSLGATAGRNRLTAIVGQQRGHVLPSLGIDYLSVYAGMIDRNFEHLHLPDLLEEIGADAYLNPTFAVPAIKTTRCQVAIIHDVVFEDHPQWVEPALREYLSTSARFAAHQADHVVTVSEYSTSRIRAVYGTPPERVTSIPNGIPDEAFHAPEDQDCVRVRARHRLDRPYLLYLGSIERKKGVGELIGAFATLQSSGFTGDLVLAGANGGQLPMNQLTRDLPDPARLRQLGYIDEADKRPLISSAEALVYPSLYEGFGLPPLEALALGVPCLVHDGTSLPEVVGNHGVRVDVTDPRAFAAALQRCTGDASLRERTRRDAPSWVRATYSWDRAARAYLDLCCSLVEA